MQMYLVGGCVRNVLMGLEPKDLDYVIVGSTPEEMLSLGYTQVGADFPVFLKNGNEYALARTERKSGKGYHGFDVNASAEVTLEEDLRRRDLTVNAMAVHVNDWEEFIKSAPRWTGLNPTGMRLTLDDLVVDPYNGRADVINKVARPCALETFVEDPLRLVRAARFSAIYGLVWSAEMNQAAQHIIKSNELQTLSQERFFAEIEKVLKDAPAADQVREFSLRLIQFKLFEAHFYFSYDPKGIIAQMAIARFDNTEHKSMGAKLNALCPQGLEDYYAKRFKFSGTLFDQINFAHDVLNTANLLAAANAKMPMGSPDTLLMGVYESLRCGKTGIDTKFVRDMACDFEDVNLVLNLLPAIEQIYTDVCFATVKDQMPPNTPKHMYGVEILVARQLAVSKLLNPE